MALSSDFPNFADPEPDADETGETRIRESEVGRFLDLPMRVSVELDRKRTRFEEVLNLKEDSVVRMARSAGENVDLLLQGMPIGNGEIVVIDDTVGLRITDLKLKKGPSRGQS